ncbi:MAG: Rrf2 family transcriptional regulator [Oscillibacter sp.]|nr:Rrf2 family transcriptional regulator [Oscillibacter sp.]
MLITREMDYTLRILRALHQSGQLSATSVARDEHLQKAITLKLLNRLLSAGIVESRRGVSGGYLLKIPCEQLKLYDLFQMLGESTELNRCQRSSYQCENRPDGSCGVCQEFNRIQAVLEMELQRTPLSEILH